MPLAVFNWISIPWISCRSHSSAPLSLLILNKFFQVITVVQILLDGWFALHMHWSGGGNAMQKSLACIGTSKGITFLCVKLLYCSFPLLAGTIGSAQPVLLIVRQWHWKNYCTTMWWSWNQQWRPAQLIKYLEFLFSKEVALDNPCLQHSKSLSCSMVHHV